MSTVLSALNPFATQKNKKQPMQGDPLMDGYLADQESAMSTLRFITEKNSVASSVVNSTPSTRESSDAKAASEPSPAQTAQPSAVLASTSQTTAAPQLQARTAQVPTRIALFKARLKEERDALVWPPFALDAAFEPLQLGSARLTSTGPVARWIVKDYLTHKSQLARSAANNEQANLFATWADALASLTAEQATVAHVTLHLNAADSFDWCNGTADLMMACADTQPIRISASADSLIMETTATPRLAINDLTAQHSLRKRALHAPAFEHWFEEDGFDCMAGVSPIETFVQAQLLHLHQQTQKTINQLRRLSAHLHAHCPGLPPAACLHQTAQADAYVQKHGEAPNPALYALLECELSRPADQGGLTLHEALLADPSRTLQFKDITWPDVPLALQLMQTLALAAEQQTLEAASVLQMAVMDHLLREPSAQAEQPIAVHAPIQTDAALPNLQTEIQNRFGGLGIELKARGLA